MERLVVIMMDENDPVALVRKSLERNGLDVREVTDRRRALAQMSAPHADVLLVGEAALHRGSAREDRDELLCVGDLSMNLAAYRVTRRGRNVHLGPTEFRLLRFLLEHPHRVYSRQELMIAGWGASAAVDGRSIDVMIRRLRRALNGPGEPDCIRTVRSAGYSLDPN